MPDASYPTLHPLAALCLSVESSIHRHLLSRSTIMEHTPVQSSMFESIAHDGVDTLEVIMKNGKVYRHSGFSAEDHAAFQNAESMGRHYNTVIKGKFPHTVVEPDQSEQ